MILALNEDGSLPGEPLPILEALTWFFFIPVGIFVAVWVLVVAAENLKKAKASRVNEDVLTRISD
jgi:hypothetical protein